MVVIQYKQIENGGSRACTTRFLSSSEHQVIFINFYAWSEENKKEYSLKS